MEINAGSGGAEACEYVALLHRMYSKYTTSHSYGVSIESETPGGEGGYKSILLHIRGEYAYGWLKYEVGVHRMVRLSGGKRHTMFAAVAVWPDKGDDVTAKVVLNPGDLKIETMRAQG